MYKLINLLMFAIIISFILSIFKYYLSGKNINTKDYNRNNIHQILSEKAVDLLILDNDTNNVIEFNNSIENKLGNEKKRNFWNLLNKK